MGECELERHCVIAEEEKLVAASDSSILTDSYKKHFLMAHRRFRPDCAAFYLCRLMRSVISQFVGLCSILGLLILLSYWFYDSIGFLILLHVAAVGKS